MVRDINLHVIDSLYCRKSDTIASSPAAVEEKRLYILIGCSHSIK